MPYITSVERIGFERGLVQGRQEGKEECKREWVANLVLRLLNRRIGGLSANLAENIRELPIEQLEELGEALLDFNSETDLINWLNSRD